MEVSKPRIETAIAMHLAPILRADGFKGSGRQFRRTVGKWTHVVQVQSHRYDSGFCVNMSIHPVGVLDFGRKVHDPKKILEVDCRFRSRMTDDPNREDQWWSHDGTEKGMCWAMILAAETYERFGRERFNLATAADSDLNRVSPEAFFKGKFKGYGFCKANSTTAFVLAWMRRESGQLEEAKAFAEYALRHSGPQATYYNAWLEEIFAELDVQIRLQKTESD